MFGAIVFRMLSRSFADVILLVALWLLVIAIVFPVRKYSRMPWILPIAKLCPELI